MENRALAVAGGIVAFTLTTGCAGSAPDNPATAARSPSTTSTAGPSVQHENGSVILLSAEVDGVMDASLSGVIVRTEPGCLALTDDPTDIPVLWPHGATLSADGMSVDVPDFGTVTVGDEVWAGGGYINPGSGEPIVPTFPEECAPSGDTSVAALQAFTEGPPPWDVASPGPPS
ncbi:hypothetical protein [Georgenia sp. H159]|uniref:hypothetical protein n=1 Tax=Georgenia sp. H159 TaxID=3076115 RepID=UPI002D78BF14|nr:hypothetical protein [Georgenia sp. H159]